MALPAGQRWTFFIYCALADFPRGLPCPSSAVCSVSRAHVLAYVQEHAHALAHLHALARSVYRVGPHVLRETRHKWTHGTPISCGRHRSYRISPDTNQHSSCDDSGRFSPRQHWCERGCHATAAVPPCPAGQLRCNVLPPQETDQRRHHRFCSRACCDSQAKGAAVDPRACSHAAKVGQAVQAERCESMPSRAAQQRDRGARIEAYPP